MITTRLERIALQNVQDSLNDIDRMLQNSPQDPHIEHALSETIQHFNEITSNLRDREQDAGPLEEFQEPQREKGDSEFTKQSSSQERSLNRGSITLPVHKLPQNDSGDTFDYLIVSKETAQTGYLTAEDDAFYRYSLTQLDTHVDALLTIDLQGTITDVNRKMELITGRFRGELIGSPFTSCFTACSQTENVIQQLLQEHKLTNYELTARSADGSETVLSCYVTTIQDPLGDVQGIFYHRSGCVRTQTGRGTLQWPTRISRRCDHDCQ